MRSPRLRAHHDGHATAVPPRTPMTSRRLMPTMRLPPAPEVTTGLDDPCARSVCCRISVVRPASKSGRGPEMGDGCQPNADANSSSTGTGLRRLQRP